MTQKALNNTRLKGQIFFFMIAVVLLAFMISYGFSLRYQKQEGVSLNEGWTLSSDTEQLENYRLSVRRMVDAGKSCIISRNLPTDFGGGDALFFTTQSSAVRIYLDGELLYEYGYDTGIIDRSPGDFVHFVKLPEGSQGKSIAVEVFFPYKSASYMIDDMMIVDDESASMMYIRQKIIPVLISLFVFFMSIVCIICEVVLFRRIFGNPCLAYISMFLLCISGWSLTQVKIIQVVLGEKYYHSSLAYILLSLLPVLLAKYVLERFEIGSLTSSRIVVFVIGFICVLTQILNITGIWDYTDSLTLTHISLVSSVLFLIVVIIKNSKRFINYSLSRLLPFSMMFLILCGILDVINSYTCLISDYSFFSRISTLVLSLSIFIDIIESSLHMVILGEESDINRIRAHTDALTGVDNRLALDEALAEIRNAGQRDKTYGVMIFDINELKNINDGLGHEVGDKLIVESARIISHSSLTIGRVFRYGGDEFIVLVVQDVENGINNIIRNFNNHIAGVNRRSKLGFPISIAYGFAIHPEGSELKVEEVIQEADDNMYVCKRSMKK